MYKKLLFMCVLVMNILSSKAQPTIASPQVLTAGRQIMDYTPYKLVFQDDFNGTTLDRTKWRTYHAWNGMTPGDHDDWNGARVLFERYSIIRDENVEVNGGKCYLKVFKKANNWKCASCPESERVYRNGTVGIIETYFKDPVTGADMTWNSGKFEARMKMPTYHKTFGAFWLFHETFDEFRNERANEIDIVESYGDPFMPGGVSRWNNRRSQFTTHQYRPHKADLGSFKFPNQDWWDYVVGNYFTQGEYHTYTCEWDSNRVSMYLDGKFFMSVHKWYKEERIRRKFLGWRTINVAAPDVIPATEEYKVYWGFPWQYPTNTDLKIWNGWGEDPGSVPVENLTYPYSEVVIDYVKVWQRHPEKGHIDLCNQNVPKIIGPSAVLLTTANYAVDYPVTGGTWHIGMASGLYIVSQTSSSCVVGRSGGVTTASKPYALSYSYTKEGCPNQYVAKFILASPPPKSSVLVANVNYGSSKKYFQVAAPRRLEGANNYNWTINYGNNKTCQVAGQYASTPAFDIAESSLINWTLTVSNSVGATTYSGTNNNRTVIVVPANSFQNEEDDSAAYYFDAHITDTNLYENKVDTLVAKRFITDIADTVATNSMIEKIMLEGLEPYLIYDSIIIPDSNNQNNFRIAQIPVESVTKIYPNPASNILNIDLGTSFILEEPKQLVISSAMGNNVLKKELSNTTWKNSVEIGQLSSGVYFIEIHQKGNTQKAKFIKQ